MDKWYEVTLEMKPKVVALSPTYGEELYSEVLEACWRKADVYDWADVRIKGRVVQIAKNRLAPIFRVECRETNVRETRCRPKSAEQTLEQLLDSFRVTPRERTILRESVAMGRPDRDVAAEMNIEPKSLRCRRSRLLKRLQQDPTLSDSIVRTNRRKGVA